MKPSQDHEEQRDELIGEKQRMHAAAIRTNVLASHHQTLHDLANAFGNRLSADGVCEQLIKAAIASGPYTAGQLLVDMINRCINDDAELEAIKEVERIESDALAERRDRALEGAMRRVLAVA